MRLLSKKETKETREDQENRAFQQGEALNKYVSDATKKLNTLRETYRVEKERLQEESSVFLKEISRLKSEAIDEVADLEHRKKCIEESSNEKFWNERHNRIEQQEKINEDRNKLLDDRQLQIEELELNINSRANELEIIERELSEREITSSKKEEDLQNRLEQLKIETTRHDETVKEKINDLDSKKFYLESKIREVELSLKANDAVREELENQRREIEKDRRAIKDGYESLARAENEINSKK